MLLIPNNSRAPPEFLVFTVDSPDLGSESSLEFPDYMPLESPPLGSLDDEGSLKCLTLSRDSRR